MKNSFPPLPVRILVIVIVLSTIGYFGFRSLNPAASGQLNASGTIESVVVNVSPEMAGRVVEVLVNEGQPVVTGDPLLRLDDSLLGAQRAVASAQVDSAKA
ncbi:MAG: biotin/lipoyl-binding protein, partial [Chloroflexota bacterium]